jgi:hypothetical protein
MRRKSIRPWRRVDKKKRRRRRVSVLWMRRNVIRNSMCIQWVERMKWGFEKWRRMKDTLGRGEMGGKQILGLPRVNG